MYIYIYISIFYEHTHSTRQASSDIIWHAYNIFFVHFTIPAQAPSVTASLVHADASLHLELVLLWLPNMDGKAAGDLVNGHQPVPIFLPHERFKNNPGLARSSTTNTPQAPVIDHAHALQLCGVPSEKGDRCFACNTTATLFVYKMAWCVFCASALYGERGLKVRGPISKWITNPIAKQNAYDSKSQNKRSHPSTRLNVEEIQSESPFQSCVFPREWPTVCKSKYVGHKFTFAQVSAE